MTRDQTQLLRFLWDFYQENDQIPPMATISRHFGWASISTPLLPMRSLVAAGMIERNVCNKYKFTAKGRAFLACSDAPLDNG
jgi:hypothetical protein